jgi:hypothetical protein
MATYYIDPVNGNNANNGLGPDASHGTNKPFATIGKILATSGVGVSGDIVYLAPGVYREVITVNITSPVSELAIIGDPANAQGFKTAAGVLVAPGDVIWTGYTTNDTSAPSSSPNVDLNGRDFLTFQYIVFIGGNVGAVGTMIRGTTTNSVNIVVRDCTLINSTVNAAIAYTGLADVASNWTIDRCIIHATIPGDGFNIILPTSASADYDTNFLVQNCVLIGGHNVIGVNVSSTGAGSFKGGGVDVLNCTFQGWNSAVRTQTANLSTSIPCTIYNSIILATNLALNASAAGNLIEDYNRIRASTNYSNVSAGANTVSTVNHALLIEVGQAYQQGRTRRPFLAPASGSPLLGWGGSSPPSVDLQNRPRPAGGASTSKAVGAYERHNTAAKETTTVDAGGVGLKITGPGDHDIAIPVDTTATTITVRVRYDTTHGTGSKPQAQLLAAGDVGYAGETVTAAAGVDTWETLTFASFTPTQKGAVTLRLISRAAAGSGIAYFDTVTGGAQGTQGLDYFDRGEPFSAAVATATGGGGLIGSGTLTGGMQ